MRSARLAFSKAEARRSPMGRRRLNLERIALLILELPGANLLRDAHAALAAYGFSAKKTSWPSVWN
jgi:hypothetical protein